MMFGSDPKHLFIRRVQRQKVGEPYAFITERPSFRPTTCSGSAAGIGLHRRSPNRQRHFNVLSGYNTYGTNVNVTTAAAIGENDDPLAVGSNVALLNTSATATGGAGPSIAASTLETDLNLTAGTFSAYTVGSALSQTFNSFAGNKLSFDANFLTNDTTYNSAAYYYVLGPSNTVVASGLIGSVTTAGSNFTPGTDTLFTNTETGWNSFPATTLTLGTAIPRVGIRCA